MQLLTEPALAGHFRGLGFPLHELYIQFVWVCLVPPFRVPENVKKKTAPLNPQNHRRNFPKDHHGTSGAGSTIKAMGGGSTVNMSGFRLYFLYVFSWEGDQNTPWKIDMEPTNHPFWKENDLPNLHAYVPC